MFGKGRVIRGLACGLIEGARGVMCGEVVNECSLWGS